MPTVIPNPAVSGVKINALDLIALTDYYNEYWNGNSYAFDAAHHTDLNRRYGWGQIAANVVNVDTGITITTGDKIFADHVNQVISQINTGYHHIDDAKLPVATISPQMITESEIISTIIHPNIISSITEIDPIKYKVDLLNLSIAEATSINTQNWEEDLEVVHKFTFTDYDDARHFFNSGGELTLELLMTAGGPASNMVWQQIFEQFDNIRIGAEGCRVVVDHAAGETQYDIMSTSSITPKGFYTGINQTSAAFATILDAGVFRYDSGNAYASAYASAYVYIYSEYNSRRIRIQLRADEVGGTFNVYVKVILVEDAEDDMLITQPITLSSGYAQPATTPLADPSNYFTAGGTMYQFINPTAPVVTEHTPWTKVNVDASEIHPDITENLVGVLNQTDYTVIYPIYPTNTSRSVGTVTVAGVDQILTTDYTVTGQVITFTTAPAASAAIVVTIFGNQLSKWTSADPGNNWVHGTAITAGSFVPGAHYSIVTLGTTTQAEWEAAGLIATVSGSFVVGDEYTISALNDVYSAGAFQIGSLYTILVTGTTDPTDFTLIGSANNTIGTTFTATGVGSGAGTATGANTDFTLIGSADSNIGTVFTATGVGTGTGAAMPTAIINTTFRATSVGTGTGTANDIIFEVPTP